MNIDNKRVNKEHYRFQDYVDWRRWHSYYYQIREALGSDSKTFLIIGKGDGIVPLVLGYLLNSEGWVVDTFDYAEDLCPTYQGDLRDIERIINKKYDCVICCQVLEHLEWQYFEAVLESLARICSKRLIVSLPVRITEFSIYADLPRQRYIKRLNVIFQKLWIKKLPRNDEHCWEVGIKGKSKKYVKSVIEKYIHVEKDFHVPGYSYHWFVIGTPICCEG